MMLAKFITTMSAKASQKSALSVALITAIIALPACNTISVSQQTQARAISAQRGNIVSDNKLSSKTVSTLLSAGLNDQACLQHFDVCLTQLGDSMLDDYHHPELAIFAELHYAKARQLANSQDCRAALTRAPLDPYYANAPLTAEQLRAQQQKTSTCLIDYQARLFDAVKFSYAYLFYDALEHDFVEARAASSTSGHNHRIANDSDIQTQDIYNAASNDVITQLYESADNTHKLMGDTKIEYLPINDALRDNTITATIANRTPLQGKSENQIKVMTMQVHDYKLNIYLPNENNYLQNAQKQTSALAKLTSTYELKLSGLNSISKRSGLGISLVASLDDRYTTTIRKLLELTLADKLADKSSQMGRDESQPSARIYPTGHLLMTGVVKPTGNSVLEVLDSRQLNINLYNPYQSDSVDILGNRYPLAANFSAGYGMWLAENQLEGVSYLNLLSRKQEMSLPKLFMLEPYNPDKRVIIMIHGLASSPATWVNLTNDIFNDDKLRDNYQVWQIFYPTNLPILENRYQIQQLISETYQQTDPSGQNIASHHSVIISHSMGALISRMMLSDDNLADNLDRLDNQNVLSSNKRQIDNRLKQAFENDELSARFELESLPQVDTAVFLSAPFRGTDYADRWFTRAIRRIIYLPLGIVKTVTDNLATIATEGDLAQNPLGALYLQNGASQLSNQSSFIQLTRDIDINKRITYHSIIANNDADITQGLAQMQPSGAKMDLSQATTPDNSDFNLNSDNISVAASETAVAVVTVNDNISQALTERLSDGIVPYTSAHLDGAASETVINGGHSIQENPQTVLTLRRILHQQLQQQ